MKIAIHYSKGSFSDTWVEYCQDKHISYKLVNCYDSDIIYQIRDCDALMWHHHHTNYKDVLFAKQLLYSVKISGRVVFPDYNTNWHFDDKVGQKYLLEGIKAPLVPSHVFYDKETVTKWLEETDYPKVFKLRGGAGSKNVKLIRNKLKARKLVNQAFGSGFPAFDNWNYLKEISFKRNFSVKYGIDLLRGLKRGFFPKSDLNLLCPEKGYIYIQDFFPNDADYRVIIIGEKAIAIKRLVRKGDFRASGSGIILYDRDLIDENIIDIAFKTSEKLESKCCAYDFIYDNDQNPMIVEISYGFASTGYEKCPGFWDKNLNFYSTQVNPYSWMVDLVVEGVLGEKNA